MKTHENLIFGVVVLFLFICPAIAQSGNKDVTASLKKAFEKKWVIVKVPMPATKDGVDLVVDNNNNVVISQESYERRLRKNGTAIVSNATSFITKIEVKNRMIVIQLNGGGFDGSKFPYSSSNAAIPSSIKVKSESEVRTESMINRDPSNEQLRRDLEYERYKTKKNEMNKKTGSQDRKVTEDEIRNQFRLRFGSRFNIKFADSAIFPTSPDSLKQLLRDYIDFVGGH